MLSLFLLVALASGAPFYRSEETVDRVVDGVNERSYIVVFNENGPYFGHNMEKLQAWLESTFDVKPDHVQHIYEITKNFRGYAFWATSSTLEAIIAHEGTKYVSEDGVARASAPFTVRPDWGQVRSNTVTRLLHTAQPKPNLYDTQYPAGGNATDGTAGWDFTDEVYRHWHLDSNNREQGRLNDGHKAKIWVVDTGVLANHQEFVTDEGFSRVVETHDIVTPGGNGSDCNGHGTHCAGSAAGRYRGVAVAATIASVRVLNCQGSGSFAQVIAGFDYVQKNQDPSFHGNVMSVSLGGGTNVPTNDALNNAVDGGVIAVVAAGNNNNANACNYSPAGAKNSITVMASTRTDTRASFTNTGNCCHVFAAGESIHSAYFNSPTTYSTLSGTSMATPLTAGSIAILLTQSFDPLTSVQVKDEINKTGTHNIISGTFVAGTPNVLINARWGL
jgi:subtilisin family serine protease